MMLYYSLVFRVDLLEQEIVDQVAEEKETDCYEGGCEHNWPGSISGRVVHLLQQPASLFLDYFELRLSYALSSYEDESSWVQVYFHLEGEHQLSEESTELEQSPESYGVRQERGFPFAPF